MIKVNHKCDTSRVFINFSISLDCVLRWCYKRWEKERVRVTNLRTDVQFEMQMSVSRHYKPSATIPSLTLATLLGCNPFAVSIRRSRGRVSNIRFKLSNWISATEAPRNGPSSPNALETRIVIAKIEIGRSIGLSERYISRLWIVLAESRADIALQYWYI